MTRRLSRILSFVIVLAALVPAASVTSASDGNKTYYRVTVLPVDSTAMEERVRAVTQFLLDEPQVKTAKPFTREELERLMKPWLDGASSRYLPLPGLIEVEFKMKAPNIKRLRRRLAKQFSNTAELDVTEPIRSLHHSMPSAGDRKH